MFRVLIALIAGLIFAGGAAAQDLVPVNPPPEIRLATATKKDGKVEITLIRHVQVPVVKVVLSEENGKKVERKVTEFVPQIQKRTVVADGKSVTITRKDGKKVDPEDLPKLLQKPTAVVVFDQTTYTPLFLEVVRDDALLVTLPLFQGVVVGKPE